MYPPAQGLGVVTDGRPPFSWHSLTSLLQGFVSGGLSQEPLQSPPPPPELELEEELGGGQEEQQVL